MSQSINRAGNCLFLFITLLFSCAENKDKSFYPTDLPEEHLEGVVENPGDNLLFGYPLMARIDEFVLSEPKEDLMVKRYLVKNDTLRLVEAAFSRGQGPLEMLSVARPRYDLATERIYLYDPNTRKELYLSLAEDSIRVYPSSLIGIDSLIIGSYAPVSERLVVVGYFKPRVGYTSSAIVGFVDHEKEAFIPLEGVGRPESHQYSFEEAAYFTDQTRLLSQPGGSKIFLWLEIGQYAEIFNLERGQVKGKKILFDEFPNFEIGDNMMPRGVSDDVKQGIYYVNVTPRHVYVGLPRATVGDARAQKKGEGDPKFEGPAKSSRFVDQICVFDWDGTPVRNLKLNRGIGYFVVDPDDTVIYAMSEDDDYNPIIIRYSLK